jgi:hypothetical protein
MTQYLVDDKNLEFSQTVKTNCKTSESELNRELVTFAQKDSLRVKLEQMQINKMRKSFSEVRAQTL